MSPTFFFIVAVLLLPFGLAGLSLAPWVPTKAVDLPRIHKQLALKTGDVFYELGCGEGRVCRYVAKHNPSATVVGIEMMLPMYLVAKVRQLLIPIPNLSYIRGNVLKTDLSKASALYTYALIQTINTKLKPKFLAELTPGSRVVSYHFAMKDWPGKQSTEQPSAHDVPIHVYYV